ncbi:IPT/TIG domain-containing protein [Streptomyces nigrescens]|uniref:IPT/TIG domain-containing protein n=1 Tax=Streptomyces nigrescens TaxID=1920 RepID=UPI0036F5A20F
MSPSSPPAAPAPSRRPTSTSAPRCSSAFAPLSGPLAGGNTVTLTGTHLIEATAVRFGATAATSFTVVWDTRITAVVPAGAAGPVQVTVTTVGGTSNPVSYTSPGGTSAPTTYTRVAPPGI